MYVVLEILPRSVLTRQYLRMKFVLSSIFFRRECASLGVIITLRMQTYLTIESSITHLQKLIIYMNLDSRRWPPEEEGKWRGVEASALSPFPPKRHVHITNGLWMIGHLVNEPYLLFPMSNVCALYVMLSQCHTNSIKIFSLNLFFFHAR
jgi:hypothetical protein